MAQRICPDCGGRFVNPTAVRCRACYRVKQSRGNGRRCTFGTCSAKHYAKDLCFTHWVRQSRGYPMDGHRVARKPYVGTQGYVIVHCPDHPNRNKADCVFEHRLVMEQVIGRSLLPEENVHHINGQRADNRPENLELWSKSQPAGQRVADKVAWAIELLKLYQPGVLRKET